MRRMQYFTTQEDGMSGLPALLCALLLAVMLPFSSCFGFRLLQALSYVLPFLSSFQFNRCMYVRACGTHHSVSRCIVNNNSGREDICHVVVTSTPYYTPSPSTKGVGKRDTHCSMTHGGRGGGGDGGVTTTLFISGKAGPTSVIVTWECCQHRNRT